ncbi:MAG: Heme exporter protein, partial [Pseudomonadota bacterium]
MSAFIAVLRRDVLLALRRKAEVLTGVFFFVVVASLFPLAIGPEMATLRPSHAPLSNAIPGATPLNSATDGTPFPSAGFVPSLIRSAD